MGGIHTNYINNITNYINSITTQPTKIVASGHGCYHCYMYQIPFCAYCAKQKQTHKKTWAVVGPADVIVP